MNLTMKSACALLLVGSLTAIAPTAQASSYWESKVSNKDVRWGAKTQSFGYETWLNKRNKKPCLLYTSPSPRDRTRSRMPSSA